MMVTGIIYDIPTILTLVLIACVVLVSIHKIIVKLKWVLPKWWGVVIENIVSILPVLLVVWAIRSFIGQPFIVPTGSLEPSVLPVEFLLVNQISYGIRLPVLHRKIMEVGSLKRGDIVVFRWPANPRVDYVKRLVGLPGDHIQYHDKQLTINGQKIETTLLNETYTIDPAHYPVQTHEENLLGVRHKIYLDKRRVSGPDLDFTVPAGQYFMMGDNRDFSLDGRVWGFVPDDHVIGKGMWVVMSWDRVKWRIRFDRIGTRLSP